MSKGGKLDVAIFEGETINTPSMLCVADYLNALDWAQSVGGLAGLMVRANRNAQVLFDWIAGTPWVENLAEDRATWSNTSVCLKIVDPSVRGLPAEGQAAFAKKIADLLDKEGVARDIGSYRDAPPGLRIWTGATVEAGDIETLVPWLDWAFAEVKAQLSKAA
jgi:phosphoserine aminotransferase